MLGACVTHSDIEDARVPDVTRGAMQRVAAAIAYRAVRNRGTIGGSLSHADPAADWVTALSALGAKVSLRSLSGVRKLAVEAFITGALESALAPARSSTRYMFPRCPVGEMGLLQELPQDRRIRARHWRGPDRSGTRHGPRRIGALGGAPIVLADAAALFGGRVTADFDRAFDGAVADAMLAKAGISRAADRHIHVTALRRAISEAAA